VYPLRLLIQVCVCIHFDGIVCFLLLLRDEKLAFRATRSVRRNKNPCLSPPGGQGIGRERARQKYVLDQITLYHFTPLRFSIKPADGLCPGNAEFFSLSISPTRCHANLYMYSASVLHQSLQKMFWNWHAKENQKLGIMRMRFLALKGGHSSRPVL
jgi:hypothetical protein